jgi:putative ABC transport system permease protein
MTTPQLILKEALHRKVNFLLSLLGVAGAVTLFVFFFTASEASRKETARLMRDIGLNLRIIPRQTDMNSFWTVGFSDQTMPEAFVDRLASQRGLNYTHMQATLQKRIVWRDRQVILTGIRPEMSTPDRPEAVMTFRIEPGTVYVGFELARDLGLKKGQSVDISGKSFRIERCLSESGSDDDIRIYAHLHDVQALLNLPGRINEIKALNCVCLNVERDPIIALREQLGRVLPETKVIQMKAIADAREQQRRMVERYLSFIMPFVLVLGVVWVGLLAMINARERRQEIGILRAIGHGSGKIAGLLLGRAVVVGVLGAFVGFIVGTELALTFGAQIFRITAKAIYPMFSLLGWSVLGASAFSGLAGMIPATLAITEDPAVTLSQE